MVNVKIPPIRSEVAEVMKLLRRMEAEQQVGVLEITEGIKMIAEKKQRVNRRFHSELPLRTCEETP